MDACQLFVAVVVPEHLVVRCLFLVHVLKVVRHEQRQLAIKRLGGHRARGLGASDQMVHAVGQGRDGRFMLDVLAIDGLAGAGLAGLHGRMDEVVLMPQVRPAQVQQLHHAVAGFCKLQVVLHIHAAQAQQGVGHEGAQRLVDAGVHVHAGGCGLGLGQCGDFAGVDLHRELSFVASRGLSAPCCGAPGRVHHAPVSMPGSLEICCVFAC